MDKRLLIRHIKNEATPQEREEVIAWIDESRENEAYYMALMNTIIQAEVTKEHPGMVQIPVGMKQDALREIRGRLASGSASGQIPAQLPVPEKKRGNLWKWVSCAAAVLLGLSVTMNIYQFGGKDVTVAELGKVPAVANLYSTYYTENGVKGRIILPDSSIVWLNSGSRITYPDQFDSDRRRVSFEGEGYFEVTHNPEWPMEVITPKGMKVEVLGTKFHIKSYQNDEEEQATLFSGRIDISKSDGQVRTLAAKVLKPRESLRFTPKGTAVFTEVADTTKKVAWKRGELLFEQTPMPEVVKMLERWHGMEVIVEDPAVLSYKYTASFTSESIVQIMELFRFTSPLDYTIEEKKIYLKRRRI